MPVECSAHTVASDAMQYERVLELLEGKKVEEKKSEVE
jgi:hypothetical protein